MRFEPAPAFAVMGAQFMSGDSGCQFLLIKEQWDSQLTEFWLSSNSVDPSPSKGVIAWGEVFWDGKGVLIRRLAVFQVTLDVCFGALQRTKLVNKQNHGFQ